MFGRFGYFVITHSLTHSLTIVSIRDENDSRTDGMLFHACHLYGFFVSANSEFGRQ